MACVLLHVNRMEAHTKEMTGAYEEILRLACMLRVRDPNYLNRIMTVLNVVDETYPEVLQGLETDFVLSVNQSLD